MCPHCRPWNAVQRYTNRTYFPPLFPPFSIKRKRPLNAPMINHSLLLVPPRQVLANYFFSNFPCFWHFDQTWDTLHMLTHLHQFYLILPNIFKDLQYFFKIGAKILISLGRNIHFEIFFYAFGQTWFYTLLCKLLITEIQSAKSHVKYLMSESLSIVK